MITQEHLKSLLHYDQGTGIFNWLVHGAGRRENLVAGCVSGVGYVVISIEGKAYQAHRLAFLYMVGSLPDMCDHKNRVKSDNRWNNLRPATNSHNQANAKVRTDNTSGYKGVSWHKKSSKWQSQIRVDGEIKGLGLFDCKHNAFCEYVLASRKHFGEFSSV